MKAEKLMATKSCGAALIAQVAKNPLARQETPVPFLGWEDPLEKGKAARSCILTWMGMGEDRARPGQPADG